MSGTRDAVTQWTQTATHCTGTSVTNEIHRPVVIYRAKMSLVPAAFVRRWIVMFPLRGVHLLYDEVRHYPSLRTPHSLHCRRYTHTSSRSSCALAIHIGLVIASSYPGTIPVPRNIPQTTIRERLTVCDYYVHHPSLDLLQLHSRHTSFRLDFFLHRISCVFNSYILSWFVCCVTCAAIFKPTT